VLVSLCTEEESVWQRHRDNILEDPDVKRGPLEPVTKYDQMHSFISGSREGRINLLSKTCVLLDLKSIGDPVLSPVPDIALFKYQRSVSFHVLMPPVFLTLLIKNNIQLFNRLKLSSIKLHVHLDDLSCFLSDHIVQLPRKVLRRETKVLGEDYVPEDVLAVASLNSVLVLA